MLAPGNGTEPFGERDVFVVGEVLLRTGDLQLTVAALLEWANHHDLRLHQFTAQAASLQETFLAVAEPNGTPHDEEWMG